MSCIWSEVAPPLVKCYWFCFNRSKLVLMTSEQFAICNPLYKSTTLSRVDDFALSIHSDNYSGKNKPTLRYIETILCCYHNKTTVYMCRMLILWMLLELLHTNFHLSGNLYKLSYNILSINLWSFQVYFTVYGHLKELLHTYGRSLLLNLVSYTWNKVINFPLERFYLYSAMVQRVARTNFQLAPTW